MIGLSGPHTAGLIFMTALTLAILYLIYYLCTHGTRRH